MPTLTTAVAMVAVAGKIRPEAFERIIGVSIEVKHGIVFLTSSVANSHKHVVFRVKSDVGIENH